jgi:hypothetical protein
VKILKILEPFKIFKFDICLEILGAVAFVDICLNFPSGHSLTGGTSFLFCLRPSHATTRSTHEIKTSIHFQIFFKIDFLKFKSIQFKVKVPRSTLVTSTDHPFSAISAHVKGGPLKNS